jgi:hypothetical protein
MAGCIECAVGGRVNIDMHLRWHRLAFVLEGQHGGLSSLCDHWQVASFICK